LCELYWRHRHGPHDRHSIWGGVEWRSDRAIGRLLVWLGFQDRRLGFQIGSKDDLGEAWACRELLRLDRDRRSDDAIDSLRHAYIGAGIFRPTTHAVITGILS
jgi:hypothetical protein